MNTSNKDSIEEALRTPARINKKKAAAYNSQTVKKPITKKKLLKVTEDTLPSKKYSKAETDL